MNAPPHDGRALARAGADALRRGDGRAARELFTQATAVAPRDPGALLGLAYACRYQRDHAAAGAAADRVLALEPRNVRALVIKADSLEAAGDVKAASAFYLAALRAAPPPDQAPPDLAQELGRARAQAEQHARRYEEHLRSWLASCGFDAARAGSRFGQSLDILLGRKRIYVQEPRYYYFPGLPQRQFYERADFPWLDRVEAATTAIREELLGVLGDPRAFAPYVQGDPRRPHTDQQGMLNNPDWSAFYLWRNGERVAENAARCPRTLEALEAAPLARIPNRSPSVLFSQLRPGAHIPPHNGMVNTRLICHLPLVVPGKCRFRVGNEVREWQPGRAWVFDDSIDHEAWNDSDATRVILLFDIERPEIDDEERRLINAMFEGIDAYTGTKPVWDD
ncbi:MAG TPA: aspartyl/asparaginyl beta-hydroxylase domain-containing protein [Steroidobacteraceae bacterium]|nr:aspartyl/asparaginyl beta-hydroxylase domain-containing protein [Steroidobacteraceae bacterium]